MTGFAGFTLTSASGAHAWVMPTARSSAPVTCPVRKASAGLRPAPSAMPPGNWVAGAGILDTTPCSWSVEIVSGMPAPAVAAA